MNNQEEEYPPDEQRSVQFKPTASSNPVVSAGIPSTERRVEKVGFLQRNYVAFVLEVVDSGSGLTWMLRKRFNEFENLRNQFKKDPCFSATCADLVFPTSSLKSNLQEISDEDLETRRVNLELWLTGVVEKQTQLGRPSQECVATFFTDDGSGADSALEPAPAKKASSAKLKEVPPAAEGEEMAALFQQVMGIVTEASPDSVNDFKQMCKWYGNANLDAELSPAALHAWYMRVDPERAGNVDAIIAQVGRQAGR